MAYDPMQPRHPLSRRGFLASAGGLVLIGASAIPVAASPTAPEAVRTLPSRRDIVAEFTGRTPTQFGMFLPGMVRHGRRRVALTFDACGGSRGSGYDAKIIATLREKHVPATLF